MDPKGSANKGLFPVEKNRSPAPGERSTVRGTIARITYQNPEGAYTVARLEGDGVQGVTVVGGLYPVSEGQAVH